MKQIRLSDRLLAIANMVTPGLVAADVGCDHAHLAVYLVQNGICPMVFASDIHKGPLAKAAETVRESGLSDKIETILCDGLTGLFGKKVDCVILAGMGGPLMTEILKAGTPVCEGASEFILEPQSEPALLRHYLRDNGYRIISEDMVCEENKFYPVMKCVHGVMRMNRECYFRYGKILIKERHPLLLQYLYTRRKLLKEIYSGLREQEDSESVLLRREELSRELSCIEEALGIMESESPVEIERIIR